MSKLIGVRFEKCGKLYYYMSGMAEPVKGDMVLAESDMGLDIGRVVSVSEGEKASGLKQPVRAIIRVATEADLEQLSQNETKEKEAFNICREKISLHCLPMKLIRVRYLFDAQKIIFYFVSDGRVDFRSLVRDLASIFRTRIELRQIGVRDEARMMGGLGSCGRQMCCASCIPDFAPVSIKMAKEQGLALNPANISGACGRLMCCLSHENDTYEHIRAGMPKTGDRIVSKSDAAESGAVIAVNVLRRMVKVLLSGDDEDRNVKEYSVDDIRVIGKVSDEGEGADEFMEDEGEEQLRDMEAADIRDREEESIRNGEEKPAANKEFRAAEVLCGNKRNIQGKENTESSNRNFLRDGKKRAYNKSKRYGYKNGYKES